MLPGSKVEECLRGSIIRKKSRALPGFYSVFDQEAPELIRPRRVTQFPECLRFYLANALTRDVELLADLLERCLLYTSDAADE